VSPADLSILEEKARPGIPSDQNKRTIERTSGATVRRSDWPLALEGNRSTQPTGLAKQFERSLMHYGQISPEAKTEAQRWTRRRAPRALLRFEQIGPHFARKIRNKTFLPLRAESVVSLPGRPQRYRQIPRRRPILVKIPMPASACGMLGIYRFEAKRNDGVAEVRGVCSASQVLSRGKSIGPERLGTAAVAHQRSSVGTLASTVRLNPSPKEIMG
jgi:hypothetical protein